MASAMEDKQETEELVVCMSAKDIKKKARPIFAANPAKYYPTERLTNLGFVRTQCPTCQNNYWRHKDAPEKKTCGDSQCEGKYSFIGKGSGIGRKGQKLTYAGAWESFRKSLTSARVPCTAIARYPVVARWRADVEYVAAGIYCFQPYCVTGELDPPANPLICPQFCLRFNDLDNIGLTGRHYSGFIMLGIQVFNKPNDRKFWHEDCIEFNFNWLTKELGIDPKEITFIEDVWAGGGNLGPSIEYFVGGLELGNMVFMQFKTFPDGNWEPLDVQVIDVGIGLERVPWLVNGSPTSYVDVFPRALDYLLGKIDLKISSDVWEKYGPLSCLLNVDEAKDMEGTWKWIASQAGLSVEGVKAAIEPIRDVYIVLDHTRTVLMAIEDGSLPSNIGGASNIRNILRRVFAILKSKQWWDKLGMDGFLGIFDKHREDLATIYGPFKEYKSFRPIIELEYHRWAHTEEEQKDKLEKFLKKKKGEKLSMDDWILIVTSWGIPPEMVSKMTGQEKPDNMYNECAERQEKMMKSLPTVLYNTANIQETVSLYYKDHLLYKFKAKIVKVLGDVLKKNAPSVVILDQSSFYPTSGGQEHDTGKMTIKGVEYKVVDVQKVGPCVLHFIEPPLPSLDFAGAVVEGEVDQDRREQLRNHHTATHIVYSACRKVLGPHVWQNGAKKSVHGAHLDITHFRSLSHEETLAIENEANRVVHRCKQIRKGFMPKDEAEKKYGFHLYQGGVVPGNELRVVDIVGTDTEACCGTHCDNTAEVGAIKILKTGRISDGILRLNYVAGENALKALNEEATILTTLTNEWGVGQKEIVDTAKRFFTGYKTYGSQLNTKSQQLMALQLKCALLDETKLTLLRSDEETATLCISSVPAYAQRLKDKGKGVVFVGASWAYGLLGAPAALDLKKDVEPVIGKGDLGGKKAKLIVKKEVASGGKKSKDKVDNIAEFTVFSLNNPDEFIQLLQSKGFVQPEL